MTIIIIIILVKSMTIIEELIYSPVIAGLEEINLPSKLKLRMMTTSFLKLVSYTFLRESSLSINPKKKKEEPSTPTS